MYTRFDMVIPGIRKERGDQLSRRVENIVEDWEQCLSLFRSGAELQIINELASKRAVRESVSMSRVLDICNHYNMMTDGLFDPAVNQARSRWIDVIRDRNEGTIKFANPGAKLDMGGIGKGIALEDVVVYLRSEGVTDAFISFGESSLAGMGKHPHGNGWLVGSREQFLLRDEFVSVSGLQNLRSRGEAERVAHIYHPVKRELIRADRSVMLKCSSPVEAEVLSTCGYMADEREFERLKSQFPNAQWRIEAHL
jgi:thiamine biosynthesis lipoprotein